MSIRLQVIDALDHCIDSLDRRLEKARALRDEVAKLPDEDPFFAVLKELKQSRYRSCRKLFDQMTVTGLGGNETQTGDRSSRKLLDQMTQERNALEGLASIDDVLKKIEAQKEAAETRYFEAGQPG